MSSAIVDPPSYRDLLTINDISEAAAAAVEALNQLGYSCYIFGSTASIFYGVSNITPNNVDIAVYAGNEKSVNDIQDAIISHSSRFAIQSLGDEDNNRALCFQFPNSPYGQQEDAPKECRVDIVIAGTPCSVLPTIPRDRISSVGGLPLPSLKILIITKLSAWWFCKFKTTPREGLRDKVSRCAMDIKRLLALVPYRRTATSTWCPNELHETSEAWVALFVEEKPMTSPYWAALGFNVSVNESPFIEVGVKVNITVQ